MTARSRSRTPSRSSRSNNDTADEIDRITPVVRNRSGSTPKKPATAVNRGGLIHIVIVAVAVVFLYSLRGTIFETTSRLVSINEYLEGAVFLRNFSVLDFFGSLLVCRKYRLDMLPHSGKSWFEVLLVCTLMQFGGTTLSGLLLGQVPSWILSHNAFPALFLSYWLTFCCPGDIFWKITTAHGPLTQIFVHVCNIFAAISAGHAVTSWGMDKAIANAFHSNAARIAQSTLTCIFCGTISACGGGLLVDIVGFSGNKSNTLYIFTIGSNVGTATLNRSFWLAAIYYLLLNVNAEFSWRAVSRSDSHLVICLLQVTTYVLSQVVKVDPFQELSDITLRSLQIPSVLKPK